MIGFVLVNFRHRVRAGLGEKSLLGVLGSAGAGHCQGGGKSSSFLFLPKTIVFKAFILCGSPWFPGVLLRHACVSGAWDGGF